MVVDWFGFGALVDETLDFFAVVEGEELFELGEGEVEALGALVDELDAHKG